MKLKDFINNLRSLKTTVQLHSIEEEGQFISLPEYLLASRIFVDIRDNRMGLLTDLKDTEEKVEQGVVYNRLPSSEEEFEQLGPNTFLFIFEEEERVYSVYF